MKKIFLLTSLLFFALSTILVSCKDDNEYNPTMQTPETFQLNAPADANVGYDLGNMKYTVTELFKEVDKYDSIAFTYKQPDYGYTAAVKYFLQISLTEDFLDFKEKDTESTTAVSYIDAQTLDKMIMLMGGYSQTTLPSELTVYARVRADLTGTQENEVYSNVVSFKVKPYYLLVDAKDPVIWYLVGSGIGSVDWSNSESSVGTGLVPMCAIENATYDPLTGNGPIEFIDYFSPSQAFKFIKTPGNWDYQIGGSYGSYVINDGGSGNISVPAAGYYKVSIDMTSSSVKIEPYTETVKEYTSISVLGKIQGVEDWDQTKDDHLMEAVDTRTGGAPHVWMKTLTLAKGDEIKFLADKAWTVNWGYNNADKKLFGYGSGNAANFYVPEAGTYNIIFNDVTGYFQLYKQ